MATTTWLPHASSNRHKNSWLLTNGQIIDSPDVETTSTERRFRVAGTTMTGYRRDIDMLIYQGVEAKARALNAKPWICLGGTADQSNPANFDAEGVSSAKLHFLTGGRQTILFWRFRHPDFPVDAVIQAVLQQAGGYGSSASRMNLTVSMNYPSTNPNDAQTTSTVAMSSDKLEVNWHGIDRYGSVGQKIEAFLNRTKPEFLTEIPWGLKSFETERDAIRGVAKLCRLVDDLTGVQIPDLRDPEHPKTLDLGLLATNVTPKFMDSLTDYLDSQPVVTRVFEAWQEITKTFRSVGIVVGEIKKSDLYQLMTHQNKPVHVGIGPVAEESGQQVINTHSVTFDLATGTIAVVCSGNMHGDEVATEYEASKIRARLTGETDELLGFAQEFARRRAEIRAKEITEAARKRDRQDPFA